MRAKAGLPALLFAAFAAVPVLAGKGSRSGPGLDPARLSLGASPARPGSLPPSVIADAPSQSASRHTVVPRNPRQQAQPREAGGKGPSVRARLKSVETALPRSDMARGSEASALSSGERLQAAVSGEAEAARSVGVDLAQAAAMVGDFAGHPLQKPWTHKPEKDPFPAVEAMARHLEAHSQAVADQMAADARAIKGLAHSLQNKLAAVIGLLGLLLDMALHDPAMAEQMAGKALKAAEAANDMVQIHLDLHNVQRVGWTARLTEIPIAQTLAAQVTRLGPAAKAKQITIEVDNKMGELLEVRGDPNALAVVLDNLIENALKYSGENGKVTARLALSRRRGYVRISVADEGIGIGRKDIEILLDDDSAGYRTAAGKKHAAGHGIGMPEVRRLLKAMGSRLEIKSKPGKGSEFAFELPLADFE
ncbi:MAG: HAMP domain-containing histidine kinase [Elusimicrobia bacterium]|nr:HAMP domain-containing histidine kinase [Elusimicrobiota bacterium]